MSHHLKKKVFYKYTAYLSIYRRSNASSYLHTGDKHALIILTQQKGLRESCNGKESSVKIPFPFFYPEIGDERDQQTEAKIKQSMN